MPSIKFGNSEMEMIIALAIFGAYALLRIVFMVCVWNDCEKLRRRGRDTVLLPAPVWGLSALVFGLLAVGLYWAVHHSRLARRES